MKTTIIRSLKRGKRRNKNEILSTGKVDTKTVSVTTQVFWISELVWRSRVTSKGHRVTPFPSKDRRLDGTKGTKGVSNAESLN